MKSHDIEDDSEPNNNVAISIVPPVEDPNALTDCDSDESDDEVTCNPDHLPSRILLTNVITMEKSNETELQNDSEHEPVQAPKTSKTKSSQKKYVPVWKKVMQKKYANEIPVFEKVNSETVILTDPVQCLNKFWTDEFIESICYQSKVYAIQKSLPSECMTPENLRVFFAILLISGYNKLPYRRMYWETSEDCNNALISKSMRRDTFEQIMRILHFADNMEINQDRFYKVRPLIEHLNKVCKQKEIPEYTSIDEVMVPYYGKHGDKQYIRGKPIRFGFKLWAACSADGSLLHVEPYCGSHTRIPDRGFGHGPNIVLEMVNQLNLHPGQQVVFDNLFTNMSLMKELSKMKIGGTGTLREDRQQKAPLSTKAQMMKKPRGYMEEVFSENISVTKWRDNKPVMVASNKHRSHPLQKTSRWDKAKKKQITVDMPYSISVYNKFMGGVDLFDQTVSSYRIRIRSKKWWWPIFAWSLNAQTVCAWRLYKEKGDIPLLEFTRHVAIAILTKYGTEKKRTGPKLLPKGPATSSVRFNEAQHWTMKGNKPNARCRQCSSRTIFVCKMCDVPLHPECMEQFHTK